MAHTPDTSRSAPPAGFPLTYSGNDVTLYIDGAPVGGVTIASIAGPAAAAEPHPAGNRHQRRRAQAIARRHPPPPRRPDAPPPRR